MAGSRSIQGSLHCLQRGRWRAAGCCISGSEAIRVARCRSSHPQGRGGQRSGLSWINPAVLLNSTMLPTVAAATGQGIRAGACIPALQRNGVSRWDLARAAVTWFWVPLVQGVHLLFLCHGCESAGWVGSPAAGAAARETPESLPLMAQSDANPRHDSFCRRQRLGWPLSVGSSRRRAGPGNSGRGFIGLDPLTSPWRICPESWVDVSQGMASAVSAPCAAAGWSRPGAILSVDADSSAASALITASWRTP